MLLKNTELRLQILGNGGKIGTCPKEHENLANENNALKAKNRKLTDALNNALSETTNLMERALLVCLLVHVLLHIDILVLFLFFGLF